MLREIDDLAWWTLQLMLSSEMKWAALLLYILGKKALSWHRNEDGSSRSGEGRQSQCVVFIRNCVCQSCFLGPREVHSIPLNVTGLGAAWVTAQV